MQKGSVSSTHDCIGISVSRTQVAPRVIWTMESTAMSILSFSFPFGLSVNLYFCREQRWSTVHGSLGNCMDRQIRQAEKGPEQRNGTETGSHLKDGIKSTLKTLYLDLNILPASRTTICSQQRHECYTMLVTCMSPAFQTHALTASTDKRLGPQYLT